jgi:hypothetical protein
MTAKDQDGNGRVTVAVLGTKLDGLIEDVRGLRKEHDEHIGVGTKVLERLSALEAKWTVLMWGAPISLTIIGVTTSIIFALR